MRICRTWLPALLSLSLLGATLPPLGARMEAAVDAKPKRQWSWLSKEDEQRLFHSIPPAPAAGSPADQADLAEVLKLQTSRTPDEIAEAMSDKTFRLEIVAGHVLSPNFTPQNFPVAFNLLLRVRDDESRLNSKLKKDYARPRPFAAHPEVHPLFQAEEYSYPSGHASGSRILADILGELFPAKKAALLARAEKVAHGRLVAGVHYPSDLAAGKQLAQALSDALLANPAFQNDLATAKTEIAQRQDLLKN